MGAQKGESAKGLEHKDAEAQRDGSTKMRKHKETAAQRCRSTNMHSFKIVTTKMWDSNIAIDPKQQY